MSNRIRVRTKRGLRRAAVLLGLLAMILAVVPYVCSRPPLRDMLFSVVFPKMQGSLCARQIHLGWFSPVACEDLEIFDPQGVRSIAVPQFQGDRPLWRMIAWPGSVGGFRAEHARVEVVVDQYGVNLAHLVDPTAKWRMVGLSLEVVDGVFTYRRGETPQAWELAPFNLGLEILPAHPERGEAAVILIKPGRLFDRASLTPQMSADLLKFLAPVLAEASSISGQFSLELDAWRIPLDRPEASTGSGRLTLHQVVVAPGALTATLTQLLHLPPEQRLAENLVVSFRMADGRFYHENLRFAVPNLKVCTHGSVGLDQSLDLTAEIQSEGKVLGPHSPLAKRPMTIVIRGTLDHPQIDLASMGLNAPVLLDTFQSMLKNHGETSPSDSKPASQENGEGSDHSPSLLDRLWHKRSDSR